MLRKMLSILIAMVMLLSMSATFVSANDSSGEESFTPPPYEEPEESGKDSTFDEAYAYFYEVLESKRGINGNYFTEESFAVFYEAAQDAHFAYINAYDDMFTAEDLLQFAEKLINAYDNLEGLVYGDVNGDGSINAIDLLAVRKEIISPGGLTGLYKKAANVDKNVAGINAVDLLMIRKHILKEYTIEQ